jgi:ABC-2 type transport system permease protein
MGFAEGARAVRLIALREIGASFDSWIAPIAAIAFTLLANSIFMNGFFLSGKLDLTPYFDLLPLLFAFFLPAISMRLWAEETKHRTIEFLLTLPIRPFQAVLGKYLAALFLFGLFLLGSLPLAFLLEALGEPDRGLIVAGYLGAFLLGAFLLALGMLCSALARDQIVAFVTTALVGFFLVQVGDERVVAILDGLFPSLALGTFLSANVSALAPYHALERGLVELSALVYFAGGAGILLWISALWLERSRA